MKSTQKLGFVGLAALVFSMMVGAGIFNIPQNMASGAGLLPSLLVWVVTAAGMMMLVSTFRVLSTLRSDLNSGIYQYARAGWGRTAGFSVAWGYWLSACFANVAYAVMLNDTLGAFYPPLLRHDWLTVALGSVLIWLMCFLVGRGMRTAKALTSTLSLLKIVAILLIIILMAVNVKLDNFRYALADMGDLGNAGAVWSQVRNTMMVTLWCFIGIEGAVMMSGRAKNPKNVGLAGVTGFLIAWLLYVAVSIFSFGIMHRAALSSLEDPSVAYVLRSACGDWAMLLVLISVTVSILGGWMAWTLVCGEVPYEAARSGVFPGWFARPNKVGMPWRGLVASSVVMQGFLMLVVTAENVYMAALNITGMMILPAYLASGMYLWKISKRYRWLGVGCTLFCLWMIYAGGLDLMLYSLGFYLLGLILKLGFRSNVAKLRN